MVPRQPPSERQRISSGSPFEPTIGFSRAVRVGNRILVSGTAPIWPDGTFNPDPAVQARRCLEIVVAALREAGAGPETSCERACISLAPPTPMRLAGSTARCSARLVRPPPWSWWPAYWIPAGKSRSRPRQSSMGKPEESEASGVSIRQATIVDVAGIARAHADGWHWGYRGLLPDAFLDGLVEPPSLARREAFWHDLLSAPPSDLKVWVAEQEGRILGFCQTGPSRDPDASPSTGEVGALYLIHEAAGERHRASALRGGRPVSQGEWIRSGHALGSCNQHAGPTILRSRRHASGWHGKDGAGARGSTRGGEVPQEPSMTPMQHT